MLLFKNLLGKIGIFKYDIVFYIVINCLIWGQVLLKYDCSNFYPSQIFGKSDIWLNKLNLYCMTLARQVGKQAAYDGSAESERGNQSSDLFWAARTVWSPACVRGGIFVTQVIHSYLQLKNGPAWSKKSVNYCLVYLKGEQAGISTGRSLTSWWALPQEKGSTITGCLTVVTAVTIYTKC